MFYKDTLSFMISDIDWIFSSFFITIYLRINMENFGALIQFSTLSHITQPL